MQAIATAQASVVDGCNAEVLGLGEAGDINDPNSFFCNVQAIAEDNSFSKSVVVEAIAEATAYAGCYEDVTATADAAAEVHIHPVAL